jgi:hypothetical protein
MSYLFGFLMQLIQEPAVKVRGLAAAATQHRTDGRKELGDLPRAQPDPLGWRRRGAPCS